MAMHGTGWEFSLCGRSGPVGQLSDICSRRVHGDVFLQGDRVTAGVPRATTRTDVGGSSSNSAESRITAVANGTVAQDCPRGEARGWPKPLQSPLRKKL